MTDPYDDSPFPHVWTHRATGRTVRALRHWDAEAMTNLARLQGWLGGGARAHVTIADGGRHLVAARGAETRTCGPGEWIAVRGRPADRDGVIVQVMDDGTFRHRHRRGADAGSEALARFALRFAGGARTPEALWAAAEEHGVGRPAVADG